jgi:hypothetical protein
MPLRRKRNRPCSTECLTQAGEHRQVSVEPDALQSPYSERRESGTAFSLPARSSWGFLRPCRTGTKETASEGRATLAVREGHLR